MVHQERARADFGFIGGGRFGAFAAACLAPTANVRVWDPRWDADEGGAAGLPPRVLPASLADTCQARVVILAVPIRAIPEALTSIAPHLLPKTLVADTASVKVWPCRWLLQTLPADVEIIGTHPLFGPDSAAAGLRGHKIALAPLRTRHLRQIRRFLESLGLKVLLTTPADHDRSMAETQSLVHWIGRGLERYGAHPRDMDTLGYRRLLEILEYVVRDSWELFTDLQRWNPYAEPVRADLLRILSNLDREVRPAPPQTIRPPVPRRDAEAGSNSPDEQDR